MAVYDVNGDEIIVGGDNYNISKWAGKIAVVEGNSLVAFVDWGQYLASFLGMTVHNVAQSGSSIVVNPDTGTSTMTDIKNNVKDNYPDACDLVIMQGDTNTNMDGDYSDQMDGSDPKTTWTAKMNYMIRCIKAKYHNVVIVLMPDSIRYDYVGLYGNPTATLKTWATDNFNKYEIMRDFAHYNRIAFFDFDHSTPWNPNYADNYYNWAGDPNNSHTYANNGMDYVHPSYGSYADAKGKALAEFVAGLVYNPSAPNTATEGWDTIYTVTLNLGSGVTARQNETSWWAKMIYQNKLTGESSVTVTMGGVDITSTAYKSSLHEIRIEAVTGNLVITAS